MSDYQFIIARIFKFYRHIKIPYKNTVNFFICIIIGYFNYNNVIMDMVFDFNISSFNKLFYPTHRH